jgi:hypothetical protein
MDGLGHLYEVSENPDWEKLGGDYFVADWEKLGPKNSAVTEEAKVPNVSE